MPNILSVLLFWHSPCAIQGDFFFKIDKTLKFDGIFEVFPHPMYTVGYAWMYGVSMISNSFQVFALTMFCHLMQMVFLAAMEEPHIQRTYGVEFEKNKSTHRENIFIIHNFDPFRASDWMMVIICILFVLTTIVCGGVLGKY
jgi:phosphatidylethanolamine N-methyltransferase